MPVGDACQPVFVPAVGLRAGMVVRHSFPGCAVGTVVFPYGTPCPLAYIRTPALPVLLASGIFFKPLVLCQERGGLVTWRACRPRHEFPLSDIHRERSRLLRCATCRARFKDFHHDASAGDRRDKGVELRFSTGQM